MNSLKGCGPTAHRHGPGRSPRNGDSRPASERVDLSDLRAPTGGSRHLTGHLTRPEGTGPWPALAVVHEAFGVDDAMLTHAARLAGAGYLALMPDLYRQGGAPRCLIPTMRAALSGRGRAHQDIEAARTFLLGLPDCTGTTGIIGFCMGGSFALIAATRGTFEAASVNYGTLPRNLDTLTEACPVVASYGGRDRTLKGEAARLRSTLARLGVSHDVHEYPQAGRSFLNTTENGPRPLRPLFRILDMGPERSAAADAWQRIESFLATHLKEPRDNRGDMGLRP